jgi:hypothetical protein
MNTSYIKLLQLIKQFADNHLQVKRFSADFDEQVDSYGNTSEAYPILYVAPQGNALGMNTNTFTVTVYCFDLIQEGRQNINYIISDTDLILNDLYIYLRDGNYQHLDVLSEPTVTPLNNFLLDYAAGNQMTLTVEVESYGLCEIPIEPIPPVDDCEALLHSLTSEQLNECILPSYNFANPAVFGNLTQQQIDDLTDELCGGGQPIDIYINGVLVVSQTTVDTYLDVVNTANTPVGTWNGSEWVAPNVTVRNSDTSYLVFPPSGTTLNLPDIRIIDSDGTLINYPSVQNFTCTPIPPCADATVNVNSTLFDTVASGGTLNISVRQQSGSTEIGSKQGQHWRVNNSAITVNSSSLVSLPATDAHNLDIKYQNGTPVGTIVSPTLVEIPDPVPVLPSTAIPIKTGGVDGGRGREVDWFTLSENNPYGNTTRFLDTSGGTTFANDIIVDWFHADHKNRIVLAVYRSVQSVRTHAAQITHIEGLTIAGFSGWFLWNRKEAACFQNCGIAAGGLNYSPLNITVPTTGERIWIETESPDNTAQAYIVNTISNFGTVAKTTALRGVAIRYFTFTELGL